MKLPKVRSAEELSELVNSIGFLPFFKNDIEGFSLAECTPAELWFAKDVEGPWEWKGPVITRTGCAYGKLFRGRSGYISRGWYPDFANVRRGGMDFDERYAAGLMPRAARQVYGALLERGGALSRDLKWMSGCERKAFDAAVAALQMQAYVVTVDFEYLRDGSGKEYGWGVARYDIPERVFGDDFAERAYMSPPDISRRKILAHLSALWPDASEKKLIRLIDG